MKKFATTVLLALSGFSATAGAAVVNLTPQTQQHSWWCWAASAKMVFDYYGKNYSQCEIVNYTLGVSNACDTSAPFEWNNKANSMIYSNQLESLLNAGGVPVYRVPFSLAFATVVNRYKPYILIWRWTAGGGHAVVVKGYQYYGNDPLNGYVFVQDPWPGRGQQLYTYDQLSGRDRMWVETIIPTRGY